MKSHNVLFVTIVLAISAFAALLFAACGDDDGGSTLSPSDSLTVGDTVETDTGKLTVRSFESPVDAEDDFQPQEGTVFATVAVKGCVNSSRGGVYTFYAEDLTLELPDGTEAVATRAAKSPALGDTPIAAGECAEGFVTYQIPADVTPEAVAYKAIPRAEVAEVYGGEVTLRWAIP